MFFGKRDNIHRHAGFITQNDREKANGHKSLVVWLTGLSGSGKSTIALKTEKLLFDNNILCYVVDGDNTRLGLNRDLGFSADDRAENLRRVAEVAYLFRDAGFVVLCSFISPYAAVRRDIKNYLSPGFLEVFIDCPVAVCEDRDPKGLYAKARSGIITDFTGVNSPYQAPMEPDVHLRTDLLSPDKCADILHKKILSAIQ